MKIALACAGVGQIQRGYERFFADLFRFTRDRADITLYKGGGATSSREIIPTFVSRTGTLGKLIPLHWAIGRSRYHFESLTFGLAVVRRCIADQTDILHIVDPPLIKVVHLFRRKLGGKFKILFSHAGTLPFGYHPYADYVHHIGPDAYLADLAAGHPRDRHVLIPLGVDLSRFATDRTRASLRAEHNIPLDAKVVLSVAALNRHAKRVDAVIEEIALLPESYHLWLDGSFDPDGDRTLIDLAREKLGDRCRFTHVPSGKLGELFRLADIKVLGSLHEAFGLAVVEAMACGLPVVVNDTPHFRWLTGDPRLLTNLAEKGALAAHVRRIIESPEGPASWVDPARVRRRFSWDSLAEDYLELYRCVAAGRPVVQAPEHLPAQGA